MLTIDEAKGRVTVRHEDGTAEEHALDTPEAFEAVSAAWLRCGWDVKYVYGFTWMGRPMIQLPEDMIRIQEVIWRLRPDVIVETGVAHGGSLIFYASLFEAMGQGRVIGIDIEIRQHNRIAIEAHPLARRITLIQGSSTAPDTLAAVHDRSRPTSGAGGAGFQPQPGACRGGTRSLCASGLRRLLHRRLRRHHGAARRRAAHRSPTGPGTIRSPRSTRSWRATRDFVLEEPGFPFNEGRVRDRVTYWPKSFLKRR